MICRYWKFFILVLICIAACWMLLPSESELLYIQNTKVVRLEVVHKEYIVLPTGNPDMYVKLRLDFNLNDTYLYTEPFTNSQTYSILNDITADPNNPFSWWSYPTIPTIINGGGISHQDSIGNLPMFIGGANTLKHGSEIFYFGLYKLRLPVIFGYPDPYYTSTLTNRVQHEGVLGLGRSSAIWQTWQTITITDGNLVLGMYDEREANLLDKNTFSIISNINPFLSVTDTVNLPRHPCYVQNVRYDCSFDFSHDKTFLPPALMAKTKFAIKWPHLGREQCIDNVQSVLSIGRNTEVSRPMFETMCSYVSPNPDNFTLIISHKDHVTRKASPTKETVPISSLMIDINTKDYSQIILGRTFMLQQMVVFWNVIQDTVLLQKVFHYSHDVYPIKNLVENPVFALDSESTSENFYSQFHLKNNPSNFDLLDDSSEDISSLNFYLAFILANVYIVWYFFILNQIKYRPENVRLYLFLLHLFMLITTAIALIYNVVGIQGVKIFTHHIHTFFTPQNNPNIIINTNYQPTHPAELWFTLLLVTIIICYLWNCILVLIGVYHIICTHFQLDTQLRCIIEKHEYYISKFNTNDNISKPQHSIYYKEYQPASLPYQPIKPLLIKRGAKQPIVLTKREPISVPFRKHVYQQHQIPLAFISQWYNNGPLGLLHYAIFEYTIISVLWICLLEYRDIFHAIIIVPIYMLLFIDQITFLLTSFMRGKTYLFIHLLLCSTILAFVVMFNILPYIELMFPLSIGYSYITIFILTVLGIVPATVIFVAIERNNILSKARKHSLLFKPKPIPIPSLPPVPNTVPNNLDRPPNDPNNSFANSSVYAIPLLLDNSNKRVIANSKK